MVDMIWIAAIGTLFAFIVVPGTFWITDRTGSDHLAFLFMWSMLTIIFPLIVVFIIQR